MTEPAAYLGLLASCVPAFVARREARRGRRTAPLRSVAARCRRPCCFRVRGWDRSVVRWQRAWGSDGQGPGGTSPPQPHPRPTAPMMGFGSASTDAIHTTLLACRRWPAGHAPEGPAVARRPWRRRRRREQERRRRRKDAGPAHGGGGPGEHGGGQQPPVAVPNRGEWRVVLVKSVHRLGHGLQGVGTRSPAADVPGRCRGRRAPPARWRPEGDPKHGAVWSKGLCLSAASSMLPANSRCDIPPPVIPGIPPCRLFFLLQMEGELSELMRHAGEARQASSALRAQLQQQGPGLGLGLGLGLFGAAAMAPEATSAGLGWADQGQGWTPPPVGGVRAQVALRCTGCAAVH